MWFSNALIYQYELNEPVDLAQALADDVLKPCPPHARFIYGWVPAMGDELVHEVAGCQHICLGKEERILPRAVITRTLEERIQAWETEQGRAMKRNEKAQLAEELEFELLPKSFCLQKKMHALLDTVNKRLIINTASVTQAAQLITLLRKSVQAIHVEPLAFDTNLSQRFVTWLQEPATLPSAFQLAADCLLFSPDNEKKRFACKGCELPAEEIETLLAQGLVAAEISLIWQERIQLTLTHDLILKRVKCLDYLVDEFNELQSLEEEYQQKDAALTLLAGELRQLQHDLFNAISAENALPSFMGNTNKADEIVLQKP